MAVTDRIQLAPAFVLHRRAYRETSLLLDVFSQEYGRIGLVARGAKSPKSRQRGELQPFTPVMLSWMQRGELGTLTAVEGSTPAYVLTGSALFSAFYINEVLVRLLARHDPHPNLFEYYQASLQNLAANASIETTLRLFEKHLLIELGYGLPLDIDSDSGLPIQPEEYYDYHLESGPMHVASKRSDGFIFKGSSLLALDQDMLNDDACLLDAKRLMRAVLNLYLGDKPLKSRELFRKKTH